MLANTYNARLNEDGLTEMMEAYRAGDAGVLAVPVPCSTTTGGSSRWPRRMTPSLTSD